MPLSSYPHLPSWQRLACDPPGEAALTLVERLVLADADPSAILGAVEACDVLRGTSPGTPGGSFRLSGPAMDLVASRCRRPTAAIQRAAWEYRVEAGVRLLAINPFLDGPALNTLLRLVARWAPHHTTVFRYLVAAGARREVLALDAATLEILTAAMERPYAPTATESRPLISRTKRARELAWIDALQDAHLAALRGAPTPRDATVVLDWQRGLVDERADGSRLMDDGDAAGGDLAAHPDTPVETLATMMAAWPSTAILRGVLHQTPARRDTFLRHPGVRAEFVAQMAGSDGGVYARYLLMHPDPADSALAFQHFAHRDGTLDVSLVTSLLEDPETPPATFTTLDPRWLVAALEHANPEVRLRALLATRGAAPTGVRPGPTPNRSAAPRRSRRPR